MNQSTDGFYGLGIAPGLLDALSKHGFKIPTPIQRKAIPIAIEGKDIIGIAQTGTGKTIAFGIPMIQRLAKEKGRALVIVPTRELAIQVNAHLEVFARELGMRTSVLIGGEPIIGQVFSLRKNPRIIVATPGRLLDHTSSHHVRLDDVHTLVLDEADRMLDMGFAPQIESILDIIPKERQTMLFSATIPDRILHIASRHMKLPVSTEIAPTGTAAEGVSQEIFVVNKEVKVRLLGEILKKYTGSALVFSRTKRGATQIVRKVRAMGHAAAEIHADRSLSQRKEALEGFKSGKYRVLIATDIAARGIDVSDIELVINYDLPDDADNYVHRIGRTGRAGKAGHAISLATPEQERDVREIEKLIRKNIPRSKHPAVPSAGFSAAAAAQSAGRRALHRRGPDHREGRSGGRGRHFRPS
ncbi:MAG: DEAD/DEAH box helicase [Endomicrobiia bacterium]|nr:DEAD/DEAH box helicase [Endomicrobiia bacterium]